MIRRHKHIAVFAAVLVVGFIMQLAGIASAGELTGLFIACGLLIKLANKIERGKRDEIKAQ